MAYKTYYAYGGRIFSERLVLIKDKLKHFGGYVEEASCYGRRVYDINGLAVIITDDPLFDNPKIVERKREMVTIIGGDSEKIEAIKSSLEDLTKFGLSEELLSQPPSQTGNQGEKENGKRN